MLKRACGFTRAAACRVVTRALRFFLGSLAGALLAVAPLHTAVAGPEGGTIVGGSGAISRPDAKTTQIQQNSTRLAIDWQTFNIANDEVVRFKQPSSTAAALNRILDQRPSEIFGALKANGRVFLVNPNGVVFGRTARVKVSSLVASSLDVSAEDFMRGHYQLEALSQTDGGAVINRGLIEAARGGSVSLIGGAVANEGVILADLGHVNLAAGRKALVDFDGDGLVRFEIDEAVLTNEDGRDAAVSNIGEISAAGGQVLLSAKVASEVFTRAVNTEGVIRAGQIENDGSGGIIRLRGVGGDVRSAGTLDAAGAASGADGGTISVISDATTILDQGSIARARGGDRAKGGSVDVLGARSALLGDALVDVSGPAGGGRVRIGGDYQGKNPQVRNAQRTHIGRAARIDADARESGDGGRVIVWANQDTLFAGSVSTRGGERGGDGGFIEISGKEQLGYYGQVDARAPAGEIGTVLLDPRNITVENSGGDLLGSVDNVPFATNGMTDYVLHADEINTASATVKLQAEASITFNDVVNFTTDNVGITAEAGGDITVNASITTRGGVITLNAGDADATAPSASGSVVINAAIDTTANGMAGGAVTLGVDGASGNIQLAADITTSSAAVTLDAPVNLGANVAIDTAGADISFNQQVASDSNRALNLNAGSAGVIKLSSVDAVSALTIENSAGTMVTGRIGEVTPGSLNIEDTAGGATVEFQDDVSFTTLATNDNGNAYDVRFSGANNNVTGGLAKIQNAGTVTIGDEVTDSFTFAGGLETTGNASNPMVVNLAGTVAATNAPIVLGPVTLTEDVSINAGNANITVGPVAEVGSRSLTLSSSAAGTAVNVNGAVDLTGTFSVTNDNGALVKDALGTLNADAGFNTTGAVTLAHDITTAGTGLTIGGDLVLSEGANVRLDTGLGAGNILLTGSVLGTAAAAAEQLTVAAGAGAVNFNGAVGNGDVNGLGTVTIASANTSVIFNGTVNIATLSGAAGAYAVELNGNTDIANSVTLPGTGPVRLGDGLSDVLNFLGGLTHTTGLVELNGTVNSAGNSFNLGPTVVTGPTVVNTGGGNFDLDSTLALGLNGLTVTTGGGQISLGAAATTTGGNLTLDAGAGAGATIDVTSFSDGDANTADLFIVQSESTRFTGDVTARTLSVLDTTTGVVIDGAVDLSSVVTAAQPYVLAFEGGGTVVTDTSFINTGGVRLGNDALDSIVFTGGLDTRAVDGGGGLVQLAGAIGTAGDPNRDLDLGAASLIADTQLFGDEIGIHGNITGAFPIELAQATGVPLEINGVAELAGRLDVTRDELSRLLTDSIVLGDGVSDGVINSAVGAELKLSRNLTLRGGAFTVNDGTTRILPQGNDIDFKVTSIVAGPDGFIVGPGTAIIGGSISVSDATAAIGLPLVVVAADSVLTADRISISRVFGPGRLALFPFTSELDIVLGAGNFAVGGPGTFNGFAGELSVGGIADANPGNVQAVAGSVLVNRPIRTGGDLTVVALGDITVDQLSGGRLDAANRLILVALGEKGGSSGNILDTGPKSIPGLVATEIVALAAGEIGSPVNPATIVATLVSAGAAGGTDPQFDVPSAVAGAGSTPSLDQFRDEIAAAFSHPSNFPGVFDQLRTDAKVQISTQTGQETTLAEIGYLDESVFREFTLFAIEVGILVPWYADENFPAAPNPADFLDVDGNLVEEDWREAVAQFLSEVEAKFEADGVPETERERTRAEVNRYLERRLRSVETRAAARNLSAEHLRPPLPGPSRRSAGPNT